MKDDKLVKGFNDGHLLEKYKPTLAQKLYESIAGKEFDYAVGFRTGVNSVRMDKMKSKRHHNIDISKYKQSLPSKDKEKDKDMGDRDK
jgi:hypothetical protein